MTLKKITYTYEKIPAAVKSFCIKAIVIFAVWQALYLLVLEPAHVPDRALTNATAAGNVKILSLFYPNVSNTFSSPASRRALVFVDGRKVNSVADPCNALELYVLYLAFLICYPGTMIRRLVFAAAGIPCIYLINIARCAFISWLNMWHKGWVDISHHYIFTTVVYLFIFYGWVLYSKKLPAYAP